MPPTILQDISLKPYNTFGLDAKAKYFVEVSSQEELAKLFEDPNIRKMPRLVLGGGSNLLFTRDYEGLIIKVNIQGIKVETESANTVVVKVGAGENWHSFTQTCVENGWAGVENLSLIPGTVGAAPIQNIGAYGVEVKEVFVSLRAYDLYTRSLREFDRLMCSFGYRDSVFKHQPWQNRAVITDVTFQLSKEPKPNTSYGAIQKTLTDWNIENPTIADVSKAVIHIRQSKLPDPTVLGNCGSFFKNPQIPTTKFESLKETHPDMPGYDLGDGKTKVPAGWLIENAGWKGKQIGNVSMHEKQALVLVNKTGQATGSEAWTHAQKVQAGIMDTFGIELSPEVNII